MTALSTLQKTSRAALVAIALAGTTAVSMMPVQAASRPSIEFNFSIDTHGREFRRGHQDRFCLSDRQVRRLLRDHGYRAIRFFDRRGKVVQVTAVKGKWLYAVAVNSCNGRIVDRDRLRRA